MSTTSPQILHSRKPRQISRRCRHTLSALRIHDRTLHIYGTSDYKSTQICSRIPSPTNILITHGPPLGHLDNNISFNLEKSAAGCYALLTALWRVRPKLHVFGHIHIARGVQLARWDGSQKAYEEVLARRVRWTGLLSLVWYTVRAWLWRGTRGEDGTVMVNAASLGGFRDEKINGAIVVEANLWTNLLVEVGFGMYDFLNL